MSLTEKVTLCIMASLLGFFLYPMYFLWGSVWIIAWLIVACLMLWLGARVEQKGDVVG